MLPKILFLRPTAVCRVTCANGGTCTAPSVCACTEGWSGNTCQQGLVKFKLENSWGMHLCMTILFSAAVCNPPCANGGHCIAPNVCNCGSGVTDTQSGCTSTSDSFWLALVLYYTIEWWDSLDIAVRCENSCIHGNCVGLNQCSCEEGWQGNTCNERMFLPAIYGWIIMTHVHFSAVQLFVWYRVKMVVNVLGLTSAAVLPDGKEKHVISVSAQKSPCDYYKPTHINCINYS